MLLLALVVVVFAVIAVVHSHNQKCTSVKVSVVNTTTNTSFSDQVVEQILKTAGLYPLGKSVGSVDRTAIENALRQNVWFDSIVALSTKGSRIELKVAARIPLIQVYVEGEDPYLISDNGSFLPYPHNVASRLIVVNGNVSAKYKAGARIESCSDKALREAFQAARFISSDPQAKAQYSQIYIAPDGQLQLYNSITRHIVVIGDASDLREKMDNVEAAYRDGIIYMPSDEYTSIDARFKDRVYATKKNAN